MSLDNIISFIRHLFNQPEGKIYLHEPFFGGNEKQYLLETIDSTFVSSIGPFVDRFGEMMQEITGAKYVIPTVNGTSALHLALLLAGVKENEEVITQPLTFVATANAIAYTGASPVFVDVDKDTLGLSATALATFLSENTILNNNGHCINKQTGKRIAAILPMHTFGFPAHIMDIISVANEYHIPVVEDAAESLGSFYKGKHTGTFGLLGTFSFNGNKIVTSGGGGAIVTNDETLGKLGKHLSTTAKVPHAWDFVHDAVGYNYRMPNLNAALMCAQLEQLSEFVAQKRTLATTYQAFFEESNIITVKEKPENRANYWLNTIIFPTPNEKEAFLQFSNSQGIMTRPIWRLMNQLPMYQHCQTGPLENANWLEERAVNLPSSYRPAYGG